MTVGEAEKIAHDLAVAFDRTGLSDEIDAMAAAILSALRRKETETAEKCAAIAALRVTGDPRCAEAVRTAAAGIAESIKAAFPHQKKT